MSGAGLGNLSAAPFAKWPSLLYPDLTPLPGWEFEGDMHPADAPGCVLIKRSTRVTWPPGTMGHEWYYIDPAKGYAVVRAELFNLPPGAPALPETSQFRQTIAMDEFRQSPQGFWYPTAINAAMPFGPANNPQPPGGSKQLRSAVRYHFDFETELPDALFEVDSGDPPPRSP